MNYACIQEIFIILDGIVLSLFLAVPLAVSQCLSHHAQYPCSCWLVVIALHFFTPNELLSCERIKIMSKWNTPNRQFYIHVFLVSSLDLFLCNDMDSLGALSWYQSLSAKPVLVLVSLLFHKVALTQNMKRPAEHVPTAIIIARVHMSQFLFDSLRV